MTVSVAVPPTVGAVPTAPTPAVETVAPAGPVTSVDVVSPGESVSVTVDPLWSLTAALRIDGRPMGITDGLVVPPENLATEGWIPATEFVDGSRLDRLLAGPQRLWGAAPHAAAALAWKGYTYWLCLPTVAGYARLRQIPLWDATNTVVRLLDEAPYMTLGMRRPEFAVLPDSPLAGQPGITVVAGERELLELLRATLVERHLAPLARATRARARVGSRILWGALASSIAYVLARTPEPDRVGLSETLLRTFDVTDLVEVVPSGEGEIAVRRRTCCLAFTAPSLAVCTDCCIRS